MNPAGTGSVTATARCYLNAPVGQHHDDEDRLVDHDHRSLSDFATATSGVLAPFTTMLASSSGVSVGVRSLSDPGG
jgi:hypothetical protein